MSVMKMCRLCGICDLHNLDILDGNQSVDPFTLREKIFTCVGIQVQRVGGVTTKICQQCYDKVTDFHKFRQICIATDKQFYRLTKLKGNRVANVNVKAESEADEAESIDLTSGESSSTHGVNDDATSSAFGTNNSNHTDTNEDEDDNDNNATFERDLHLSNDAHNIPPPTNEVQTVQIRDGGGNVAQNEMWRIIRPVNGGHGTRHRSSGKIKKSVTRKRQQQNIVKKLKVERKRIECPMEGCTKTYASNSNMNRHIGVHIRSKPLEEPEQPEQQQPGTETRCPHVKKSPIVGLRIRSICYKCKAKSLE